MSSVIQELLEDGITLDHQHIRDRVADWKMRVARLFDDITSWFPDLASSRSDVVAMNEPLMRKYDVPPAELPVLRLSRAGEQVAKFVPTGLWIVGTNGRLNLFASAGHFVIVDRSEDPIRTRWEIAPALRRLEIEPLSRSSLLPAFA